MNKKLVALLIPLMLIPLAGFAYAKWTTTVTKTYLLKAGIVKMDVVSYEILKKPKFGDVVVTVGTQSVKPYDTPVTIDGTNLQPCDWIIIVIVIHIDGTCPVVVSMTPPDPTPPAEIVYSAKVYLDETLTTEYDYKSNLPPCTTIWVWEAIHFDAQDKPEVMGTEYKFSVNIIGTQGDP